jgi:hypothetical protein
MHAQNRPDRALQATLATLSTHHILQLAQRFTQEHPLPPRRGRPPRYPEYLVLALALLQVRENWSYRALRQKAPHELQVSALPALGTLWYRLAQITDARWHAFLAWLAAQGIGRERAGVAAPPETPLVLVDGTGVGYNTPFYARYRRGAEIRRLRSHIKAVVLGYWQGGVVWVVGASLGGAYADEGRLLGAWLQAYGSGVVGSGALLVGDKLYGYRARLLEQVEQVGWVPVVRVEPGVRQRVRAGSRVRALGRLGRYGWALRARYRIEQVFGSVKRAYGSYVECRSAVQARRWVWGMLVLWNMVKLVNVGGEFFVWVGWEWVYRRIFRTPSALASIGLGFELKCPKAGDRRQTGFWGTGCGVWCCK